MSEYAPLFEPTGFYSSPNPEVEKLAGLGLKHVQGVVPNDPKFANHAIYQLLGK
jgi:2',3'-cyclic-nucleotide 2'-phosphodiesterase/3'-nucleotidase